ncbi:MAG: CPBP family intramembrane metalloprotease [Proteobacteria bacterium]|nr:CPBP family intramembrane metalloprotease [Pseudomonadota bacterium]
MTSLFRALSTLALVLCSACSATLQTARLDAMAEPAPAELAAEKRFAEKMCGAGWSLLWPGLGQACLGQPEEAAILATTTAVEVGAGVALLLAREEVEPSMSTLTPFVAAQNLWVYSVMDVALQRRLASRARYVPQDSLSDLVGAPFNPAVLKQPEVWAGTLGLLAGATALTFALEPPNPGPPQLFGQQPPAAAGWASSMALGTALFEHVAIGEEIAFRGLIQSDLARSMGETPGWLAASLTFGATHALNAALLPPEERLSYIAIAVPWITVAGSWLGWTYKRTGYNLASPVAIHFWYDLLITAVSMARDPSTGIFAMRFGGRL